MTDIRADILSRLDALEDLPTLPGIVLELERVLHGDTSDAAEVVLIIEEDPSIAAAVLRVANSVAHYSSASGTITSLRDAVVRIGLNEVSRLASAVALIHVFGESSRQLDHKKFWHHSFMVASGARRMCLMSDQLRLVAEDEAYISGLLHDIGLLILDQFFPELYDRVAAVVQATGAEWAEKETEVLGVGHGELGGRLLELWDLPDTVVQAVTWHHCPESAPEASTRLSQALRVEEFLSAYIDEDKAFEQLTGTDIEGPAGELALSDEDCVQVLDQMRNSTPVFLGIL
jgi:putative nucleotidyltransferase with HDIG domain